MKTLQEISEKLKEHFTSEVNVYVGDNNFVYFYKNYSGFVGGKYISIYFTSNEFKKPIIEIAHVTDSTKVWIDIIKSIEPEIPVKYYEITYTEKTV